eukprot:TRINITY_DN47754_c0_g1_i1.p1 TRINITY_DN47754_c0_g1~~TRINITY_DN47754_c0_g1_i1.p1  ORF type:complete len:270 (+),score=87.06 TRINITY_DN47754_c0_g1_i1:62-811(+)
MIRSAAAAARRAPLAGRREAAWARAPQRHAARGRRHGAGAPDPDVVARFAEAVEKDPGVAAAVYEKLSEERQRIVGLSWRLGDVEREFKKADLNQDGSVSVAEFSQWVKELRWGGQEETAVTKRQLTLVYMRNFVPFVGFGFIDNALMILFGDVIDASLGKLFAMSVMAAAALGNAVSNLAGAALKGVIEEAVTALGIPDPHLTLKQMGDSRVKMAKAVAGALGVFIGCLLGMLPLLFIDVDARHKADH